MESRNDYSVASGTKYCTFVFDIHMHKGTIFSIQLSNGTKVLLLYADSILVYKPIVGNLSFCELHRDIDMISEWSKANCLKFSVSKCKCM